MKLNKITIAIAAGAVALSATIAQADVKPAIWDQNIQKILFPILIPHIVFRINPHKLFPVLIPIRFLILIPIFLLKHSHSD